MTYTDQTYIHFQKLYQMKAISKNELDQAAADYKAKKQLVKKNEANLEEAN
ncbi:hypothetical protein [Candidatus Coxiella mudrowiae]|uniref:hypothetical protein n=1 Tax=Candidatus Coxiella mudrowiae TaxID=2054173 RepID=UPI0012FEAC46|nr:hypothetical protein [Candidatus Coxiella mudrowiae]